MPYLDIDKDGNIGGYITKCDRCGKIEDTMDETLDLCRMWKIEIFANRPNPKLGVFCYECAKAITPMVYMLRDVDEWTVADVEEARQMFKAMMAHKQEVL